ncbi:CaiB/BaiF CoA transferase family protein [Psychrobacter sanguinis]|uniref:CaiB/BaiF CoA transferase family protein n=1 Tax=Psychrobacter sanguinis TaxID=861445 RepID=UPI00020C6083|nr:CaiB/BaiF CoA-transferase family protein [Psychrobacter sanguinis]EGK15405.1 CAIB/BAIF family protein [Psychrobacter sp. 1501(2011)]MCD9151510.1 CoA transferase [Psychrobacter sanguinis]
MPIQQSTASEISKLSAAKSKTSTQALQGIKVLDLSRVLAGPSCTQILADLGAEVIKVERPLIGDETRHWTPPFFEDIHDDEPQATSAYYATVNRNKKSMTVDMSKPEGQAIIKKLASESDVLVENFKVGGLKKYGLDYESLKVLNPRLIYASLTGFGQTGPDAHKPGYDFISQGLSGLMSLTGQADGAPQKIGVPVVDLFAGLELTIGIQAALLARQHTGKGQWVDVALLDSAVSMLANFGMNYLASGITPSRLGNAHPSICPYQVFKAADSKHFIVACGNDSQFANLSKVLNLELHQDADYSTNPQRVKNRQSLTQQLAVQFNKKTRDEWLQLLQSVTVPCAPINDVTEAINLPQVTARDMVVGFDNSSIRVLGSPIKLSETPVKYHTPPPKLGADTHSVLTDLGFSLQQIAALERDHIV